MSASQQQQPEAPQDQGLDWKQQVAERLDAYRSKHPETTSQPSSVTNSFADSRASRIARSVASRYAAAPSYSELLFAAAEAERAAAEARVALAERQAQDALAAEDALAAQERIAQEEIELASRNLSSAAIAQSHSEAAGDNSGPVERSGSAIQTKSGTPVMPQFATRSAEMRVHQPAPEPEPSLEDLWASALVEPRSVLPSKLIEFPRELVSSHRSRPRLPETPEPEAAPMPPEPAQLRIFEVHPEVHSEQQPALAKEADVSRPAIDIDPPSIDASSPGASNDAMQNTSQDSVRVIVAEGPTPATAQHVPPARVNRSEIGTTARTSLPISRRAEAPARPPSNASSVSATRAFKSLEWAAISLDKEPAIRSRRPEVSVADSVPFLVDPASIDRRLMAFAVDFAAVTAGFLGFLLVFAASTPHLPTGFTALALAAAVYASLWILYQTLFFSLSGATAGMLYARIALCTFDDRNPTRSALRRRLAAWWLACLPLGIGFLWCFVDEDNLSWHDRMTRMYQRTY